MKNFSLAVIVCLFAFAKAYSQKLSGTATYQTQRHIEMALDSTSGMTSDMQKSIQEQLRKQFQKTYDLTFNGDETMWKENATLSKPQAPSSGIQIQIAGNSDELYLNKGKNIYKKQSDLMGKQFLIEDTLKKPEWKLEKEIKNIGQYTCFKAVLAEEVPSQTIVDGKITSITETRETTAWYTLDIPVQHGPDKFWGLPGLILEINDGEIAMMCTKVVLNPDKEVVIEVPSKGKKVTQEEYNKISEEKTKEMMERYNTPGKKGKGVQMIFSTDG